MKHITTLLPITSILSIALLAGCTTTNTVNTNEPIQVEQTTTETTSNTNEATDVAENTNSDETTEEVDTSDWLTYTNEEYGFSFRYPEEWSINDYTQTNLLTNVPNQVSRLQLNSDSIEYHVILFKGKPEDIASQIKTADPSASFVQAENEIEISNQNYQYISILAAIGSKVDYYIQSYNAEYSMVWVANPYTDQTIIHTWISSLR